MAPEPSRLLRARERLRDYLALHCSDETTVDDIVLAIEEACTNAIRHSGSEEDIEIRLRFKGDDLQATVCDCGRGFDLASFDPDKVPDLLLDHGRGLYLMSRLCDRMELSCDGGLEVRLIKRAVRRAPPPLDQFDRLVVPDHRETPGRDGRVRAMLAEIDEGFAALDWEYRYTYVNPAACRLLEHSEAEILGRTPCDLWPEYSGHEVEGAYHAAMELGKSSIAEYETAGHHWFEERLYPTTQGLSVYFRNIDERKRIEAEREELSTEREVAIGFLGLLNDCHSLEELLRRAAVFLQEKSACEAVGIRLRDGDDFPCVEVRGFAGEFVEAERRLCERDEQGRTVLDDGGDPINACMCGNVICGRTDPSLPFFTAKGSFWTDSTSELLATTTEQQRQARTRNRCNGEGYESMILTPLVVGDKRLGLLQLNDRRKGRFSLRQVELCERLADDLAIAIDRQHAARALQRSEERYQLLFESMIDGYAYCLMLFEDGRPADFVYLAVNPAFERLTGLRDVVGRKVSEVIPGIRHDNPELFEIYGRVAMSGVPESFETYLPALDTWFSVSVHRPLPDHFVAVFENVTDRKQAEEAMRRSEEGARFLADVVEHAEMPFGVGAPDGRLILFNQAFAELTGYGRAELEERELTWATDLTPPEWREAEACILAQAVGDHRAVRHEKEYLRKDGSRVPIELFVQPVFDDEGAVLHYRSFLTDITERKQAEANQALLTGVLQVLNRAGSLRSLVGDALRAIQCATGFDAVGLRLREGDNYPYFEHNGFTDEFVEHENFLCVLDGAGAIVSDAVGRALLECTCGLVVSGRTDPSMACFTPSGSFWTNRSTDLLALSPEDDPRTNPRNRCIHTGFQSVGLFPVRAGEEIVGLLQLNDSREGRFTPDLVRFYESLAQNIGLALQRVAAEEALRLRDAWLLGQREALEAALNGAPLQTSLGVLVRTAIEGLGQDTRAAFYLANDDGSKLHHVVGMTPAYAEAVDGFAIGPESLACGLATYTGRSVITADVTKDARWQPWLHLAERFDYRGCWSFPIDSSAEVFVGTLAVYSREPREATRRDLELASLLTNTAAIIISRHAESEVRRAVTDDLAHRAALADSLNTINRLMLSTLDADAIMQLALDEGVRSLAVDAGTIEMRDGADWIVVYKNGLAGVAVGARLSDDEAPIATSIERSGEPRALADALAEPQLSVGFLRANGLRSALGIPLLARQTVIGCLFFYGVKSRILTDDEIDFGRKLGATLSLAIENARLFQEQQRIAVTLQENLVHELPTAPGLEIGVVSQPASAPALVGGDFSDAFLLDDGQVAVLIGDVAGKGVEAAGLTETVRSTVRAFATVDASPAFVLGKTNELLLRHDSDGPHVTALYCLLDARTGHLAYASAGHPAPIHLGPHLCRPLAVRFGAPLGSFECDYEGAHTTLTLDDYLVLYTDGVTEARRGGELYGEDRLVRAVASLRSRPARELAEGLVAQVGSYADRFADDIQVLALRLA